MSWSPEVLMSWSSDGLMAFFWDQLIAIDFFPGFPGVSWQEMSHFSCFLPGNSGTRKCATLKKTKKGILLQFHRNRWKIGWVEIEFNMQQQPKDNTTETQYFLTSSYFFCLLWNCSVTTYQKSKHLRRKKDVFHVTPK